jgi:hypothetical protein
MATVNATAVSMPVFDVESNLRKEPTAADKNEDERAGMGMGIALFFLVLGGIVGYMISMIFGLSMVRYLLSKDEVITLDDDYVGTASSTILFTSMIYFVCVVATIVIASILTCGCCCARNYKLKPHVKKWATATLVTLCLNIVLGIIGNVMSYGNNNDVQRLYDVSVAFFVIESVLLFLALVFSGFFTWGRSCGAPPASG